MERCLHAFRAKHHLVVVIAAVAVAAVAAVIVVVVAVGAVFLAELIPQPLNIGVHVAVVGGHFVLAVHDLLLLPQILLQLVEEGVVFFLRVDELVVGVGEVVVVQGGGVIQGGGVRGGVGGGVLG